MMRLLPSPSGRGARARVLVPCEGTVIAIWMHSPSPPTPLPEGEGRGCFAAVVWRNLEMGFIMSERFDHILEEADCYFHDVLNGFEKRYVEEHAERCPVCKVALDEARKRFEALMAMPACEAAGELIQAAIQKVEAHEKRRYERRWRRRAGWLGAAAAVLLLVGLHVYYFTLKPAPYDLRVLGQSRFIADSDASLRVRVVHQPDGKPLKDIPVTIELIAEKKADHVVALASFTTDEQGTGQPRFHLPDWPPGDYELRVRARTGTPQVISRKIKLARSWKLMLTSDRPVYQPGQTIHLRGLALRGMDLKPVVGQEAIFTVADPKGNIIFKQKEVTSKFGITSSDCPLASEIIEGTYVLQCQLGETASKLHVEVKKYVLPKFKIDVTAGKPFYQPGQRIAGKLRADYFFGKPVAGAAVTLELTGPDDFLRFRRELRLRTDDKGVIDFAFDPLEKFTGKESETGTTQLDLHATVIDTAGQKQTRSLPVLVSAQALRIEAIPEAGTLVAGQTNTVYLLVTNPDGRPVKARLAIAGRTAEIVTNDLGVASIDVAVGQVANLPNEDQQVGNLPHVEWTIRAQDDHGNIGRRTVQFAIGQGDGDFILRADKAVYTGGDTVRLTALAGGDAPVFVDVVKDGQTILTEAIPLADGKGEHRFDLPAEAFGTLQLLAYRFIDARVLRKARVLYVRPPEDVKIAATLDQLEYRPGGTARIQFQLTDTNGKPMPGALGLAAVDEAVFAVMSQNGGDARAFFTQDRTLTARLNVSTDQNDQDGQLFNTAAMSRLPEDEVIDRETIIKQLLPFVENSRHVFDSFDDPYWQDWARKQESIPQEIRDLLFNSVRRNTVQRMSYPDNVRAHETTKATIEKAIKGIWIVIGILAGCIAVYFILLQFRDNLIAFFLVPTIVCLILCCGLVPQVQKVREASMRTQMVNHLKQLEYAIHSYKDTHRKMPGEPLIVPDASAEPLRLREWFPETLLWRPELLTDDHGKATLEIPLADSITTWRLTTSAVTGVGRLGAAQSSIKVFQPFFVDINLPVALTRGDELAVPVVVYNYLDKQQEVTVTLAEAGWFTRLPSPLAPLPGGEGKRKLTLAPRQVLATHYRIKVNKVGTHELQVTATSEPEALARGAADAIKRRIEVLPDGRPIEVVHNGSLAQPARIDLTLPAVAIEGSPRLIVKLYPSRFSQVVEGLDAIFRMPHGCFEQTSSTTYPNVLARDYLRRTKKSVPAVETKAKEYIHLGYQRLLGFEVKDGGFDWFGNPPANRTLTAYGLMEFADMAKVHEVDPKLIERTRAWLMKQRRANGSWAAEGHVPQNLPAVDLATTAYIAWAVFGSSASGGRQAPDDAAPTRGFLLAHRPEDIADPHTLALVCNALLAIDPAGNDAAPYLESLRALQRTSPDGQLAWWEQAADSRTTFHGAGISGSVETTALAALALQAHTRRADASTLAWLVKQRDGRGTWHSTQATVLALKALLSATDTAGNGERRIELAINGMTQSIVIPADQAEVMKQLDLTEFLKPGKQTLTLREARGAAVGYQATFRHHIPGERRRAKELLVIDAKYDRDKLTVGETLQAKVRLENRAKASSPMVLAELPIPAGCTVLADDFAALVENGKIAKFQVQPRSVHVYLRELPPDQPLELAYKLRASIPGKIAVPAARVFEYYDPDRQGFSLTARLEIEDR
ncbi:MAG: hypothetical protein FJ271_16375 [Planctomycetes bacterium]|nr:hypothetical protein [Planctomycetota bacterium]